MWKIIVGNLAITVLVVELELADVSGADEMHCEGRNQ